MSRDHKSRLWSGLSLVLRRLLFIVLVAFGIVYVSILGVRLTVNSSTAGELQNPLELAKPTFQEAQDLFLCLFQGDLDAIGRTLRNERAGLSGTEALQMTFLRSMKLLGVAIALGAAGGLLAGGIAAARHNTALALPMLTLTVIGVSIPSFLLALLVQIADIKVYQRTGAGLFPIHGFDSYRVDLLPHIMAPALVLAARPLAYITRVTFISLSEVMERDFIRTARAKGLRTVVIFRRHALRNAGVSIVTAVVVSLRFALASLPIVEIFFNWPGVGVSMLQGIYAGNARLVALLALALGLTFLLINQLLDVVYRIIDPRLRTGNNGEGT